MSNKVEIPMEKVGPKTLNFIAGFHWSGKVFLQLGLGFIALLGAWSAHTSSSDSKEILVKMMEEKGAITEQLRQRDQDIVNLETELESVQELLKAKDKEVADLHGEMVGLKKEFEEERANFEIREKELIERIAALKLQDGNPNSFK